MRISQEVEQLINTYNTNNVREIAEYLNIAIEYQEFRAKTLDSRLIISDGAGYIFIRPDLDSAYKNFLIV